MKKLINKLFRKKCTGVIIRHNKYYTDDNLLKHMRAGGIVDLGAVFIVME